MQDELCGNPKILQTRPIHPNLSNGRLGLEEYFTAGIFDTPLDLSCGRYVISSCPNKEQLPKTRVLQKKMLLT